MIVEDAHWVDPTSLEVFGGTVDQIKTLPVLLIVTFRPEFNAPWAGRSHVTSLALNRLGEREAAAIIAYLVGNKELPADVTAEIVERTDGIPLFVEEMTKAVLEAGSQGEARQTAAAMPSSALAVPASLHASLMARLDRLGTAKEVARIGAAVGREFSHALLGAVIPKPEADLRSALDRLIDAVCYFGRACRRTRPICLSMLSCRTPLTARCCASRVVPCTPTSLKPSRASSPILLRIQPELLARHYTEAGLIEKAVSFWRTAGQRSLERSALAEATAQLTRALDQIGSVPSTSSLRRQEINLQVALIDPLLHVKGYAAPETKAAAERARLLIKQAEAIGGTSRRPTAAVLSPLRALGRKRCGIPWRRSS